MLGKLAVTEAQQRRVFYEQQILKTQEELSKSEAEFRVAKEQSGLQVTVIIADAGVRAGADLRAQIAGKEIQIQALSRFATPQNPDLQRISSELAALREVARRAREGEQSVLDRSCVMFCSSLMSGGAHDRTQMPVLLAGKLDGALKTGRTLTYDRAFDDRRRLCNLYRKLSEHYGLKSRAFGDSTEPLRDL